MVSWSDYKFIKSMGTWQREEERGREVLVNCLVGMMQSIPFDFDVIWTSWCHSRWSILAEWWTWNKENIEFHSNSWWRRPRWRFQRVWSPRLVTSITRTLLYTFDFTLQPPHHSIQSDVSEWIEENLMAGQSITECQPLSLTFPLFLCVCETECFYFPPHFLSLSPSHTIAQIFPFCSEEWRESKSREKVENRFWIPLQWHFSKEWKSVVVVASVLRRLSTVNTSTFLYKLSPPPFSPRQNCFLSSLKLWNNHMSCYITPQNCIFCR